MKFFEDSWQEIVNCMSVRATAHQIKFQGDCIRQQTYPFKHNLREIDVNPSTNRFSCVFKSQGSVSKDNAEDEIRAFFARKPHQAG